MPVKKALVANQPQIGNLVRELRLETKLTQEEFAAELGVTCASVNCP
ncbi:helix-turn-helix transcriptional regulator [Chroococcidiopsis sp. CCALA 051]|nr:helix-turn-helix transcriptional regulator [Chroococcidiopsis sp. CCALA 051]